MEGNIQRNTKEYKGLQENYRKYRQTQENVNNTGNTLISQNVCKIQVIRVQKLVGLAAPTLELLGYLF